MDKDRKLPSLQGPLHNPEILRHVVPQNDKTAQYCHAELVEASRFSALSTYAKVSLQGGMREGLIFPLTRGIEGVSSDRLCEEPLGDEAIQ